jgi:hypothetical protein
MRTLAAALVPFVLLACSREPTAPSATLVPTFAATSDWTDSVENLPTGDIKFYASCIHDSMDEVGPLLQSFHTVTTAKGTYFYIKIRWLDGFHLVGDSTGIWNPSVPNQQATYGERMSGVNGSYSFRFRTIPYQIVNEGSGTTVNWPLRITVTINANGIVTVDRTVESCDILGK